GNPTTAIGLVGQPSRSRLASPTFDELTQTVANPHLRASSQSLTISSRVASALSSVWSMYGARSRLVRMASGVTRAAPPSFIALASQTSFSSQGAQPSGLHSLATAAGVAQAGRL